MAGYRNLSTNDVQAMRARGERFQLIDVREPAEYAIARIEGAELKPLSQIQDWIGTLSRDEPIVFFCHHGGRSQQVAMFLSNTHNFTNTANMVGGIEEWSLRIDPTVPRY
jgi:rhodanese-related sulfurtransferase